MHVRVTTFLSPRPIPSDINVLGDVAAGFGTCFLGTSNVLNIAIAFGFSIFVLVYCAASFSGTSSDLLAMLKLRESKQRLCSSSHSLRVARPAVQLGLSRSPQSSHDKANDEVHS